MDGILGEGLYLTYNPTVTNWKHKDVSFRLVIPPGEITDFSSIPKKGVLGWLAKKRGFDPEAPYFIRNGKIHDPIYFAIKHWGGILPDGWYQFLNPETGNWEDIIAYQWKREEGDAIWRRVGIEDGCPEPLADEGYWWLRKFGGLHMMFH